MGASAIQLPLDGATDREPTLSELVIRALGAPERAPCPICEGHLARTPSGVCCQDCGTELERQVTGGAWVA
jgi:hypothetical protein